MIRLAMTALLLALAALPRPAVAEDDAAACNAAIAMAEKRSAMPKRVMGTIALVESGRAIGRAVVPWPWSINVGGAGYYFPNKAAAIEAVQAFHAAGQRSIDVGCMQINLLAHPQAFDSLDAAFDPPANADYAARFLRSLVQQTGALGTAMTAYHSQTPDFAADYARRLLAVWPGAAQFGLTATPTQAPTARRIVSQIRLDPGEAPGLPLGESSISLTSARGAGWPAALKSRH